MFLKKLLGRVITPNYPIPEERTASRKDDFVSLHLGIITGESDIKEVLLLTEFSESDADVGLEVVPPQTELLCCSHDFAATRFFLCPRLRLFRNLLSYTPLRWASFLKIDPFSLPRLKDGTFYGMVYRQCAIWCCSRPSQASGARCWCCFGHAHCATPQKNAFS